MDGDEGSHKTLTGVLEAEELQIALDEKGEAFQANTHQVEALQSAECNEVRKDFGELSLQQGPRNMNMHPSRAVAPRTVRFESDVEDLKRKLSECSRENCDITEQLTEAYRVKSQLDALHKAEISKNNALVDQLKALQASLAQAFSERDHSLLECENIKEQLEINSKQMSYLDEKLKACQSAHLNQKRLNETLQKELSELAIQRDMFSEVVVKFFNIRERDNVGSSYATLEEKCSCLLGDVAENWIYSADGETEANRHIAYLEEEKKALKSTIAVLQRNLRMDIEIEQQLQRKIRVLQRTKEKSEDLLVQLSTYRNFYDVWRQEILSYLEEMGCQVNALLTEARDKLIHNRLDPEIINVDAPYGEQQNIDNECRDVHMNSDIQSNDIIQSQDLPVGNSDETSAVSEALAQAMKEKVNALYLLSQEQERHFHDMLMTEALEKKVGQLQEQLQQVTEEKLKAIHELADLKNELSLPRKDESHLGHGNAAGGALVKSSSAAHDRDGVLKSILKTSFKRLVLRESTSGESTDSDSTSIAKKRSLEDLARLRVDYATIQESLANMEHLTSQVRSLHIILLKAQGDMKNGPSERLDEQLSGVISDASRLKMAQGAVLPISWSGDASDAITYGSLFELDSSQESAANSEERHSVVSSAALEMLELLILAAEALRYKNTIHDET